MMIHQDGSTHNWVPEQKWDLIVTMDDADSNIYHGVFVKQEGTESSLLGIEHVILTMGLFCAIYTDRGSQYWITPEAGGKVDKVNLTQVGRALRQLAIEMISSYSPQGRGRSERIFGADVRDAAKSLASGAAFAGDHRHGSCEQVFAGGVYPGT